MNQSIGNNLNHKKNEIFKVFRDKDYLVFQCAFSAKIFSCEVMVMAITVYREIQITTYAIKALNRIMKTAVK